MLFKPLRLCGTVLQQPQRLFICLYNIVLLYNCIIGASRKDCHLVPFKCICPSWKTLGAITHNTQWVTQPLSYAFKCLKFSPPLFFCLLQKDQKYSRSRFLTEVQVKWAYKKKSRKNVFLVQDQEKDEFLDTCRFRYCCKK